jgi:hypothetical protein
MPNFTTHGNQARRRDGGGVKVLLCKSLSYTTIEKHLLKIKNKNLTELR